VTTPAAHLGLGRAWIGDSGPLDVVDASLTMHGPAALYSALAGDGCGTAGGFTFYVSIGFMPGWWKRDRRRYNRLRRKAVRSVLNWIATLNGGQNGNQG
jgi:hypothetical protein